MPNKLSDFKEHLQLLTPQQQIYEINWQIDILLKDKTTKYNANRKYSRLKELKHMRNKILLNY